ncbi:MAG: stalk domain-containing protein [Defluviitaleaceae bacterium]|nr:stalk domain-containing protein [Defluviitaleaceae bacterium]
MRITRSHKNEVFNMRFLHAHKNEVFNMRITRAIFIFIFVCALATTNVCAREITVIVNGNALEFDQPPIIENGRTLVPVRAIFEALGAQIEWDFETQTVTAHTEKVSVAMIIGHNILAKTENSGEIPHVTPIVLDVPPQIINGRTLVPVRAVAESFDTEVNWNPDSSTITIDSAKKIMPQFDIFETVATVNGLDVPAGLVFFLAHEIKEAEPNKDSREILEEAVKNAAQGIIIADYARKNGIILPEQDLRDGIDVHLGWFNNNPEALLEEYANAGIISMEHFEQIIATMMTAEEVMFIVLGSDDLFEEFKPYLTQIEDPDEEIFAAKHILIQRDDFEDENEFENFAQEIFLRAKAGENFDALVAEFGNDPGATANPDGYTFVSGVMVAEFEDATRALKIGEISEPFRSEFGLHIVLRVEPDPKNVFRPQVFGQPSQDDLKYEAIVASFEKRAQTAIIFFLPNLFELPV